MDTRQRTFRHVPMAGIALAACVVTFGIGTVMANPDGGRVTDGTASIVESASRMDIHQQSTRAVIDWRGFSVGAGEHVNFDQPGREAATLNRVNGPEISSIQGRLTANGQVYLVNPNGVIIGKDAKVDVGGLVATTSNISNQNFMKGQMHFTEPGKPDAKVINRGHISATEGGLVALVAPGVENHGVIQARLGKVAMAGGEKFTVDLYGDRLINFTVDKEQLGQIKDANGRALKHHVSNTGEIIADGGKVALSVHTGKAMVDGLINLKGKVQAQTVQNRNGVVALLGDENTTVEVAGQIDASGSQPHTDGGKIEVRGGTVKLAENARLDVSGERHGGQALIGGDFQGKGTGVQAQHTRVAKSAEILADSRSKGNGGQAVVWSDRHTQFEGRISARGGSEKGNGGTVEVSSKKNLRFDGDVDARSPRGKAGTLLLDPGDLTVASVAQSPPTATLPDSGTLNTASDQDNVVNVEKVNFLLQGGTSVALQSSNNLNIDATVDGRCVGAGCLPGAGLTLTAGNNLSVNQDVLTNDGAIRASALAGDIVMAAGKTFYSGSNLIMLNAGRNIEAEHLVTNGAINLNASGNINLRESLAGLNNQGIGSLDVSAGGQIDMNGVLSNAGVVAARAATVNVKAPIVANGDVALAGATINVSANATIDTRGATRDQGGHSLSLQANGDILVNADLIAQDAPVTVNSTSGSIAAAGTVTFQAMGAGGRLDIGAGDVAAGRGQGSLTLGNLTTEGRAQLTTQGGAIDVLGTLSSADLDIRSAGDVALSNVCVVQGLACGAFDPSVPLGAGQTGTLSLSSAGNVRQSGGFTTDHDLQVSAGGTVALNQIDLRKQQANLDVNAGQDINLAGDVLARGRDGSQSITSRQGKIVSDGNLLAGDLKFSAPGGSVRLEARPDSSQAIRQIDASSLQIFAQREIVLNKATTLQGNSKPCTEDCSLKLIQLGDGDITVDANIQVKNSGNVLFGRQDTNLAVADLTNIINLGGNIDASSSAIIINGDLALHLSDYNQSLIKIPSTKEFPDNLSRYAESISGNPTQAPYFVVLDSFGNIDRSGAELNYENVGRAGYTIASVNSINAFDSQNPNLSNPVPTLSPLPDIDQQKTQDIRAILLGGHSAELRGSSTGISPELALQVTADATPSSDRGTNFHTNLNPPFDPPAVVTGSTVLIPGDPLTAQNIQGAWCASCLPTFRGTVNRGPYEYFGAIGTIQEGRYILSLRPATEILIAGETLFLQDSQGSFPPSSQPSPNDATPRGAPLGAFNNLSFNPNGGTGNSVTGSGSISGPGGRLLNPDLAGGGSVLQTTSGDTGTVINFTTTQAREKEDPESEDQVSKREQTVICGGRGATEEADLGLGAPERGAQAQVFARVHQVACNSAGDHPG